MAKTYTAQAMREEAEFQEGCHGKPNLIATMLRQAADALEREEKREKKYEYAVKNIGGYISDTLRFGTLDDAKMCRNNLFCDIVRREVGEWEEVKV